MSDITFERIVEFSPAFDRRDPDPSKNYGIHGVELRMVLKGPGGAVQFLVYTNWQLPHVAKEQVARAITRGVDELDFNILWMPTGADVGYHSPKPMYDGQEPMGGTSIEWVDGVAFGKQMKVPESKPTGTFDPCPYLDGQPCYYDGSGLAAKPMLELLIEKGSDAVWAALEARYHKLFTPEAPV